MHDEIVTGERHEAVGLVIWVNLVSGKAIVDAMHFDVLLTKGDTRLLLKLVTTLCFSAEV